MAIHLRPATPGFRAHFIKLPDPRRPLPEIRRPPPPDYHLSRIHARNTQQRRSPEP
jgi:hypothetical protein